MHFRRPSAFSCMSQVSDIPLVLDERLEIAHHSRWVGQRSENVPLTSSSKSWHFLEHAVGCWFRGWNLVIFLAATFVDLTDLFMESSRLGF